MKYTHQDASGMRWRFVGSRPVSELADSVMKHLPTNPWGEHSVQGEKYNRRWNNALKRGRPAARKKKQP